jgi:hypothetical protein
MDKHDEQELRELLVKVWNIKGIASTKMVEHCLRSSKYIRLGDLFVDCADLKPSIDSKIYYDDETPEPNITYSTFYNYNIRKAPKPLELRNQWGKLVLRTQYFTGDVTNLTTYDYEEEGREVTKEELKLINEARKEVYDNYVKRLETYYKKYSNKIRTCGYWANR